MSSPFVDLHCHSTASDGTLSPSELVRRAKDVGLSALALTDHDTAAGCREAQEEAGRVGIDFICGIEVSCHYPRPGAMHLLGYGVEPESPCLRHLTATLIEGRDRRNEQMVRRLRESGIPITMSDVREQAGGAVIGRPHIAAALVKLGIVSNTTEAFRHYIGAGGNVWVDKEQLTARQAIDLIHQAHGIAVLAHPSQLRKTNDAQLQCTVKDLVDVGLDGIEVIHSDHRESFIDKLMDLARRYHLLMTGGSDFHGGPKPHIQLGRAGRRRIPRGFFDALVSEQRATRQRQMRAIA